MSPAEAGRVPRGSRLAFVVSGTRSAVMAIAFVVVATTVGLIGSWAYAPLVGWDAAAIVFCGSTWWAIARMGASATQSHATREDPGRRVGDLLVVVAAVASLAAVGLVLAHSQTGDSAAQDLAAGSAVVSIALSWATVHTLFTLRYARLYCSSRPESIDFKQTSAPTYLDFAYVSFTIGMTFQVSDTDLQTSAMRALALRHALLAYLFGAVILAAAINLVVSVSSGGS